MKISNRFLKCLIITIIIRKSSVKYVIASVSEAILYLLARDCFVANTPRNDRVRRIFTIVLTIIFLSQNMAWTAPSQAPLSISYPSTTLGTGQPSANLYIPEQYGKIDKTVKDLSSSVRDPLSTRQVVLIKDAHCNYEAQRNIAKILDILIKDYKIDLVCVEGASNKVDPSVIAGSPDDKRRKEVADEYLKKGYLTSGEVLAMERGKDYGFSIWGVEDLKLYLEDLKAFREVYSGSTSAGRFIELSKNLISNLKNRLYPEDALAFDKKIQTYKDNKLSLTGLIEYLYTTDKRGFTKCLNLCLVLKALILEKATNFNKVENERALIIKNIESRYPKEDIQELVKNSLLYKLGKISSLDYYSYLKRFIPPSEYKNYPNLHRYIQIIKIHSKIEEDDLFKELDALIESIYKIYIKDEISVKLHIIDGYINLLDKLSRLEITRDELIKYRQSVLRISGLIEFLRIQGALNNINVPYELTDSAFINQLEGFYKQPEEFYRYALERDNALINNLIERMEEAGKGKAILIVGGFHAEGVEKLLKEKNAQVITITPSITKEDTEAKKIYLSRMMDERIQPDEMIRRLGLNNLGTQVMTGIEWQDKFLVELGTIKDATITKRLERVMKEGLSPEQLKAALRAEIQDIERAIEAEGQIEEDDIVKIGVLKQILGEQEDQRVRGKTTAETGAGPSRRNITVSVDKTKKRSDNVDRELTGKEIDELLIKVRSLVAYILSTQPAIVEQWFKDLDIDLPFGDVSEVNISYYASGHKKDVFRIEVKSRSGSRTFKLALKSDIRREEGLFEKGELEGLKELQGTDLVPRLGGLVYVEETESGYGEVSFSPLENKCVTVEAEEFIEGPTVAQCLDKNNHLNSDIARRCLLTLMRIFFTLNSGRVENFRGPSDFHLNNIVVEENTGRAVLVDFGEQIPYCDLEEFLMVILFYYAGRRGEMLQELYTEWPDINWDSKLNAIKGYLIRMRKTSQTSMGETVFSLGELPFKRNDCNRIAGAITTFLANRKKEKTAISSSPGLGGDSLKSIIGIIGTGIVGFLAASLSPSSGWALVKGAVSEAPSFIDNLGSFLSSPGIGILVLLFLGAIILIVTIEYIIPLLYSHFIDRKQRNGISKGPQRPIKINPLSPEELTPGIVQEAREDSQEPQELQGPIIKTKDVGQLGIGEEEIYVISNVIVEKVRGKFESIAEYSKYQEALEDYWRQFVFMLEDFIEKEKQGVRLDDNNFYNSLIEKITERIETILGLEHRGIIISFTEEEFELIKKEIRGEIERQKAQRAAEKERQVEEQRRKKECWEKNKDEIERQVESFIEYIKLNEDTLADEMYERLKAIPAMESDTPGTIKGWICEILDYLRKEISNDLERFDKGGDWSNAGVFHGLIELYYYNNGTIPIPEALSICIEKVAVGIELKKGLEVGTIAFKISPSSDNIGKGIEFRKSGDKLIIRLPDGNEVEVELSGLTPGITYISSLKEKVRLSLNTSELGEDFIKKFDNLQVTVFTGTPETQAAGAFAHVDENGVVYLDEVLLETSAGDMTIIHEVIHAFLKGMSNKDLEDRIDKCPMAGKIRKKAGNDPALLRHYYARYYLQNPKGGGYDGSENKLLTEAIRHIIGERVVEELAGLLGLEGEGDRRDLEGILNQGETPPELLNTLRELLTKDIKDKDELSARLQIIFESAEKVVRILNMVKDGFPERIRANLSKIQEALTIYLAVNEMRQREEDQKMPKFLKELSSQLKTLASGKGFAPEMVDDLVKELYEYEDGYNIENGEPMITPYFAFMLDGIRNMFGIEKDSYGDKLLNKLKEYQCAKAIIKNKFSVSKTQGVADRREAHELVIDYLQRQNRSEDVLEKLIKISARYIVDRDDVLGWFEGNERQTVEHGLDSILKRKGLDKILPPGEDGLDISLIDRIAGKVKEGELYCLHTLGEGGVPVFNPEGVICKLGEKLDPDIVNFVEKELGREYILLKEKILQFLRALYGYKQAEKLLDSGAGLDLKWAQDMPLIVDSKHLVGKVMKNEDGTYTVEPLGEGAIWLLKQAARNNNLFILYDSIEERNAVDMWLREHGITLNNEKFRAEYPKEHRIAVSILCEGREIVKGHRVIQGKPGDGDMMLISRMAAILGGQQELKEDYLKERFSRLYKAYYKGSFSDEDINRLVEAGTQAILEGLAIMLPPIAPFVKAYYNTLKSTKEIVASAA